MSEQMLSYNIDYSAMTSSDHFPIWITMDKDPIRDEDITPTKKRPNFRAVSKEQWSRWSLQMDVCQFAERSLDECTNNWTKSITTTPPKEDKRGTSSIYKVNIDRDKVLNELKRQEREIRTQYNKVITIDFEKLKSKRKEIKRRQKEIVRDTHNTAWKIHENKLKKDPGYVFKLLKTVGKKSTRNNDKPHIIEEANGTKSSDPEKKRPNFRAVSKEQWSRWSLQMDACQFAERSLDECTNNWTKSITTTPPKEDKQGTSSIYKVNIDRDKVLNELKRPEKEIRTQYNKDITIDFEKLKSKRKEIKQRQKEIVRDTHNTAWKIHENKLKKDPGYVFKLLKTVGKKSTRNNDKPHIIEEANGTKSSDPEKKRLPIWLKGIKKGEYAATITELITISQVEEAIKRLKLSKAQSLDEISNEYLRNMNSIKVEELMIICNKILTAKRIPKAWKSSTTTLIFKGGDNKSNPLGYRPIAILSCAYKVFSQIITQRLYRWIEENDIISKSQFGFMKGRDTTEARQEREIRTQYNKDITINFEKLKSKRKEIKQRQKEIVRDTHNTAWKIHENKLKKDPGYVFKLLKTVGKKSTRNNDKPHIEEANSTKSSDPEKLYRWIEGNNIISKSQFGFMKGRDTTEATVCGLTDEIYIEAGLRQGDIISPPLYLLFINPLKNPYRLASLLVNLIAYADDLTLAANGEGMEEAMKKVNDFCTHNNITINENKSSYHWLRGEPGEIKTRGTDIRKEGAEGLFMILGWTTNLKMNWDEQIELLIQIEEIRNTI
ncbi:hypothetical protein PROFUN_09342 [Planoprotostelium fungivorum]|uniref:Reverse transcriptase domain-containing protein n=1 Tax=Planoprotostelium fungivorum TaxID=1890364 RepID=A0A2P6NGU7_9EUKA|nr:hypothetical protein PROFUN_09342 [Planoprotostelium fungivorum]